MEGYNKLVLNPEWISHGVYKIINWTNGQNTHEISLKEFVEVFKDDLERYPINDTHAFLYELMMRFELAYQNEEKNGLIIPSLLEIDQPYSLPTFEIGESLMLKYVATHTLPPDTISRFIVRHNPQIKADEQEDMSWKKGVVLENEKGAIALVIEIDRTINVSVKGADKTAFIVELRATLNDLFESYKTKRPELVYRLVPYGELPSPQRNSDAIFMSEERIIAKTIDNRPYHYDHKSRQDIPLAPTVESYNIDLTGNTGTIFFGGRENEISNTIINNNFNFYKCNIGLQGHLNELATLLAEDGKAAEAKEIENVAKALDKIDKTDDKEAVEKKGVLNRVKRILEDMGDKNASLHKIVAGLKDGISIAQDIGQKYNDFGQWLGWPPIPKPFLKDKKKDGK